MILSDREIKEALKRKHIIIDPPPSEDQFTSSALDLCLGNEIHEMKDNTELHRDEPTGVNRPVIIDPTKIDIHGYLRKYANKISLPLEGYYDLVPDKFILSITREFVKLNRTSKIAARVEGRSTLARLGLIVHLTAPTIHAGFSGQIVLEMYNFGKNPIRLTPGLVICQLIFERLGRVPSGPPRTRFLGQRSVR